MVLVSDYDDQKKSLEAYKNFCAKSSKTLPMVFNSIYHAGADPSLIVLFSTSIAQYAMMASIYEKTHNMVVMSKVSEMQKIDKFLQRRYKKLMPLANFLVSCCDSLEFFGHSNNTIHWWFGDQFANPANRVNW